MNLPRSIEELSGPWTGFWIQGRVKGSMSPTLQFGNGFVQGIGEDLSGPFSIEGTYHGEHVFMMKTYAALSAKYVGTWNGEFIYGEWEADYVEVQDRGTFEIWPLKDDEERQIDFTERELATSR